MPFSSAVDNFGVVLAVAEQQAPAHQKPVTSRKFFPFPRNAIFPEFRIILTFSFGSAVSECPFDAEFAGFWRSLRGRKLLQQDKGIPLSSS